MALKILSGDETVTIHIPKNKKPAEPKKAAEPKKPAESKKPAEQAKTAESKKQAAPKKAPAPKKASESDKAPASPVNVSRDKIKELLPEETDDRIKQISEIIGKSGGKKGLADIHDEIEKLYRNEQASEIYRIIRHNIKDICS